jgi:Domain of unknown function (DUF6306)
MQALREDGAASGAWPLTTHLMAMVRSVHWQTPMKKKRADTPADEPPDGNCLYSAPCYLREVDPAYAGYATNAELIEILNELIEGERAGAKAAARCVIDSSRKAMHSALAAIAIDEGRFCAMLSRHVAELGGTPSPATGAFYDKLMAVSGLSNRIAFLNRGQGWVVRRLREVLPRVRDDRLHGDLKTMLQVHEANIQRCERSIDADRSGARRAPPA